MFVIVFCICSVSCFCSCWIFVCIHVVACLFDLMFSVYVLWVCSCWIVYVPFSMLLVFFVGTFLLDPLLLHLLCCLSVFVVVLLLLDGFLFIRLFV